MNKEFLFYRFFFSLFSSFLYLKIRTCLNIILFLLNSLWSFQIRCSAKTCSGNKKKGKKVPNIGPIATYIASRKRQLNSRHNSTPVSNTAKVGRAGLPENKPNERVSVVSTASCSAWLWKEPWCFWLKTSSSCFRKSFFCFYFHTRSRSCFGPKFALCR